MCDAPERAAMALCEAMTSIADGQLPDEGWQEAACTGAADELARILFAGPAEAPDDAIGYHAQAA